jgi:hypothetical protein
LEGQKPSTLYYLYWESNSVPTSLFILLKFYLSKTN